MKDKKYIQIISIWDLDNLRIGDYGLRIERINEHFFIYVWHIRLLFRPYTKYIVELTEKTKEKIEKILDYEIIFSPLEERIDGVYVRKVQG